MTTKIEWASGGLNDMIMWIKSSRTYTVYDIKL